MKHLLTLADLTKKLYGLCWIWRESLKKEVKKGVFTPLSAQ